MEKPVLRRDVQLVAAMVRGRQMITFHDPYNLSESGIALDMASLPILQLLDGRHDLQDIQIILMKMHGGSIVYASEISSFIEKLDRACLLQSDYFLNKINELRRDFSGRPNRAPVYAGKSYASDPGQLSEFIREVENSLIQENSCNVSDTITGIIAPHIDVKVARKVYVDTYRRLKGNKYDLVVVLGINHQAQDGLYSATEKNYVTPFGEIETDRAFISELKEKVPEGTFTPDDFSHKTEHSIEFQTIFLHHYLEKPFSLVPILCGSVHEFVFRKNDIFSDGRFMGMVNAMKDIINRRKGRTLIVAGVDFSHVGHKFGDQLPADSLLRQALSNDRNILSFISQGKPDEVFRHAVETGDRYHVCGLPAILLLVSILEGDRREILHLETYEERVTQSAVTYASAVFFQARG